MSEHFSFAEIINCAIIMLSNQRYDMPHLDWRWIDYLCKEEMLNRYLHFWTIVERHFVHLEKVLDLEKRQQKQVKIIFKNWDFALWKFNTFEFVVVPGRERKGVLSKQKFDRTRIVQRFSSSCAQIKIFIWPEMAEEMRWDQDSDHR